MAADAASARGALRNLRGRFHPRRSLPVGPPPLRPARGAHPRCRAACSSDCARGSAAAGDGWRPASPRAGPSSRSPVAGPRPECRKRSRLRRAACRSAFRRRRPRTPRYRRACRPSGRAPVPAPCTPPCRGSPRAGSRAPPSGSATASTSASARGRPRSFRSGWTPSPWPIRNRGPWPFLHWKLLCFEV